MGRKRETGGKASDEAAGLRREVRLLKKRECELRKIDQKYRGMIASIEDLVFVIDEKGIFRECFCPDEGALYMPPKQFLGRHYSEVLPAHVSGPFSEVVEAVSKDNRTRSIEYTLEIKGVERWFVSRVSPIRNAAGSLEGTISVIKEITEQKKAEDALRESEARYRSLVELSPDGIVVHREGKIVFVNPATVRLIGASGPEQIVGRPIYEFLHPDFRGVVGDRIATMKEKGVKVPVIEEKFVRLDGKIVICEVAAIPLSYCSRPAIQVVVRDVTERKAAEERYAALQRKVFEAQKLESLGVLAAGFAHDFNNILSSIMVAAEVAGAAAPSDGIVSQNLKIIGQSAKRASEIAGKLLAYGAPGMGQSTSVDLNRLVEDLSFIIETNVGRDATVVRELAADLPAVTGDPAQLQQVIMNIAINAGEAMAEKGGAVVIRTDSIEMNEEYCKRCNNCTDCKKGRFVTIEVTDTGCGMDEDTLKKVFDPFFSTKGVGRGLGLAAVYGIVKRHGGCLKLYSAPGKGTSFRVSLPASSEAVERAEARRCGDLRGTERILIVEDERNVRLVTKMALELLGYRVVEAADGKEALDIMGKEWRGIDVAIIDVLLPDVPGTEVLEKMRLVNPDVMAILVSGYAESHLKVIEGKPIPEFIQKPYTTETLAGRIRDLLDGK